MKMLSLAMVLAFAATGMTQEENTQGDGGKLDEKVRVDVGKSLIELPLKGIIEKSATNESGKSNASSTASSGELRFDTSKGRIETTTEELLAEADKTPEFVVAGRGGDDKSFRSLMPTGNGENPRVQPGLVSWHKDFETACAASLESGKPVLLFQLLGQLDQRFT